MVPLTAKKTELEFECFVFFRVQGPVFTQESFLLFEPICCPWEVTRQRKIVCPRKIFLSGNILNVGEEALNGVTVIIRINAAALKKFLALQVRRLFEGGVYSRAAFIAKF